MHERNNLCMHWDKMSFFIQKNICDTENIMQYFMYLTPITELFCITFFVLSNPTDKIQVGRRWIKWIFNTVKWETV